MLIWVSPTHDVLLLADVNLDRPTINVRSYYFVLLKFTLVYVSRTTQNPYDLLFDCYAHGCSCLYLNCVWCDTV